MKYITCYILISVWGLFVVIGSPVEFSLQIEIYRGLADFILRN